MRLPSPQTAELWEKLSWSSGRFVPCESKNNPLDVPDAPMRAGLYRLKWIGQDEWSQFQDATIVVGASRRVVDPTLQFNELRPPVVLTIGKATRLRQRLRVHFGINPNNNRVAMRLRKLLPDRDHARICALVAENVTVEWVELESWVERCLLEAYGLAVLRPILDIKAEH